MLITKEVTVNERKQNNMRYRAFYVTFSFQSVFSRRYPTLFQFRFGLEFGVIAYNDLIDAPSLESSKRPLSVILGSTPGQKLDTR